MEGIQYYGNCPDMPRVSAPVSEVGRDPCYGYKCFIMDSSDVVQVGAAMADAMNLARAEGGVLLGWFDSSGPRFFLIRYAPNGAIEPLRGALTDTPNKDFQFECISYLANGAYSVPSTTKVQLH